MTEFSIEPVALQPDQPDLVPDQSALHPQQLGAGVVKFYKEFSRAESAYKMVNDVLHGKREMPILTGTTGLAGDGIAIQTVFDYSLLLKSQSSPEEQTTVLKNVLGPWNNYFVQQYANQLRELALFSRNTHSHFAGFDPEFGSAVDKFDAYVARVHDGFKEYLPLWQQLDSCMSGEANNDPILTIPGSERQVSLSTVLQLAGVTDREVVATAGNQLMSTQVEELQKRILPCLQEITTGSHQASVLLDKASNP